MHKNLLFLETYQKTQFLSKVIPLIELYVHPGAVFFLQGSLGVGKTFFVRNLLEHFFEVKGVTSPTFGYLKNYCAPSGMMFYHFDLYQLRSYDEFFLQGFEEILFKEDCISFVEWPEILFDNSFIEMLISVSSHKKYYLLELFHDFHNSEARKISLTQYTKE